MFKIKTYNAISEKGLSRLPAEQYTIDPDATEREWLRQASDVEQAIFRETGKGMELLKITK